VSPFTRLSREASVQLDDEVEALSRFLRVD
jgi:hypothetical protein